MHENSRRVAVFRFFVGTSCNSFITDIRSARIYTCALWSNFLPFDLIEFRFAFISPCISALNVCVCVCGACSGSGMWGASVHLQFWCVNWTCAFDVPKIDRNSLFGISSIAIRHPLTVAHSPEIRCRTIRRWTNNALCPVDGYYHKRRESQNTIWINKHEMRKLWDLVGMRNAQKNTDRSHKMPKAQPTTQPTN